MNKFTAVPFTTESETGMVTIAGIAKFSSAGIVLEFKKKLFGVVSFKETEIRVPIADILDVKFRKSILNFRPTVELRTNSFESLNAAIKCHEKLVLRIKRADFDRALDAVSAITADICHLASRDEN